LTDDQTNAGAFVCKHLAEGGDTMKEITIMLLVFPMMIGYLKLITIVQDYLRKNFPSVSDCRGMGYLSEAMIISAIPITVIVLLLGLILQKVMP
jgi:hypothetical protein